VANEHFMDPDNENCSRLGTILVFIQLVTQMKYKRYPFLTSPGYDNSKTPFFSYMMDSALPLPARVTFFMNSKKPESGSGFGEII
jgi:hypothetical protein